MKLKHLRVSLSLSLLTALIFPISISAPIAQAEEKNIVKCRQIKWAANSPKIVKPPTALLKRGPRQITLHTNCGNIKIRTFFKNAPVTLTVLSALVKAGYYNRTTCHRLTTDGIYVVQCGDPTATGMGDPGFRYKDENLPEAEIDNYSRGTVAMANSGSPGTNGSQFFLVYDNTTLGPNYTIWGEITSGIEILEHIAKAGVKGGGVDGTPLKNLVIQRVSIR
ncbi:MAG: peptidylprolyl isomerase [Candidatus Nanopelagicaceae bacterium]